MSYKMILRVCSCVLTCASVLLKAIFTFIIFTIVHIGVTVRRLIASRCARIMIYWTPLAYYKLITSCWAIIIFLHDTFFLFYLIMTINCQKKLCRLLIVKSSSFPRCTTPGDLLLHVTLVGNRASLHNHEFTKSESLVKYCCAGPTTLTRQHVLPLNA